MSASYNTDTEKRVKRRGDSLLLRLTARQVWRSVGYCVKLNIVVLLISLPIFFLYVNGKAISAVELTGRPGSDLEAQSLVQTALGFDYWISDSRYRGIILPGEATGFLGMPDESSVVFETSDWYSFYDLRYVLSMPSAGVFQNINLDLSRAAAVVKTGFQALLCMEAVMVFFGTFNIRRSTKKILRPISELAEAARMINNIQSPAPVVLQELKLSGAIDTLNTITEDHLDKRISIDDERTELKGLASAINAMLDRLDAAYQAQLRFVSDASHELRTPISVIQGYANLLDRWGKKDEKALQESIDAIKSEAHGMEGLVEQLLFLARSDNNTLKTNMGDLDISALAEEVQRETDMIDNKHVVSGSITEGLYVYGDGQLIKQAVRVFVDNALKYTPDGGRVRLSVAREDGEVKISVSDTGIGIAEKDIPQVFERFFRADESRARKTGGTGLGLAIAKYIIDSHGGYIEIVSRQNIGTKITASLPEKIVRFLPRENAAGKPDELADEAIAN